MFCGFGVYGAEFNNAFAYGYNKHCTHVDYTCETENFLLLEVLLAQLSIGIPVKVSRQDGSEAFFSSPTLSSVRFEIPNGHRHPGHSFGMEWDAFSEFVSERVYENPGSFVTVEYLEAMEYCYELSESLTKRRFVDDDVDICIARIEIP